MFSIFEWYYIGEMKKILFFDLYGTLAGFYPTRFEIQSQACREFELSVSQDGILRGYKLADNLMAHQNSTKPLRLMDESEKFNFFCEYEKLVLSGCDIQVDMKLAGEIWQTVRNIPYEMKIFDDVLTNFEKLINLEYEILVISNMNIPGAELIKQFQLEKYVNFAVTSKDVGVEKPDPRIFDYALKISNFSRNDAFHIGDQILSDISGAENAGIAPILMDRDRNYLDFDRCLRVEDMSDLYSNLIH